MVGFGKTQDVLDDAERALQVGNLPLAEASFLSVPVSVDTFGRVAGGLTRVAWLSASPKEKLALWQRDSEALGSPQGRDAVLSFVSLLLADQLAVDQEVFGSLANQVRGFLHSQQLSFSFLALGLQARYTDVEEDQIQGDACEVEWFKRCRYLTHPPEPSTLPCVWEALEWPEGLKGALIRLDAVNHHLANHNLLEAAKELNGLHSRDFMALPWDFRIPYFQARERFFLANGEKERAQKSREKQEILRKSKPFDWLTLFDRQFKLPLPPKPIPLPQPQSAAELDFFSLSQESVNLWADQATRVPGLEGLKARHRWGQYFFENHRMETALEIWTPLEEDLRTLNEPLLHAQVLTDMGRSLQSEKKMDQANAHFLAAVQVLLGPEALPFLMNRDQSPEHELLAALVDAASQEPPEKKFNQLLFAAQVQLEAERRLEAYRQKRLGATETLGAQLLALGTAMVQESRGLAQDELIHGTQYSNLDLYLKLWQNVPPTFQSLQFFNRQEWASAQGKDEVTLVFIKGDQQWQILLLGNQEDRLLHVLPDEKGGLSPASFDYVWQQILLHQDQVTTMNWVGVRSFGYRQWVQLVQGSAFQGSHRWIINHERWVNSPEDVSMCSPTLMLYDASTPLEQTDPSLAKAPFLEENLESLAPFYAHLILRGPLWEQDNHLLFGGAPRKLKVADFSERTCRLSLVFDLFQFSEPGWQALIDFSRFQTFRVSCGLSEEDVISMRSKTGAIVFASCLQPTEN
jgi:hypothetical protein